MAFSCSFKFVKNLFVKQPVILKSAIKSSSKVSSFCTLEKRLFRSSYLDFKGCLARNSTTYKFISKGYASTKYKVSNSIDTLKYGKKEEQSAKVAFMITADMKKKLIKLHYSEQQISSLLPEQAQLIVQNTVFSESFEDWYKSYQEKQQKAKKENENKVQPAQQSNSTSNQTGSAIVVSGKPNDDDIYNTTSSDSEVDSNNKNNTM